MLRRGELFAAPELEPIEEQLIDRIHTIRDSLKYMLSTARIWTGLLARATLARSIAGSNSIEGYNVSVSDAIAAVAGEQPIDADGETWAAVSHYQAAMTYILQLADDPYFVYDESFIRGLHYVMLGYDLKRHPGRWRPGSVLVRRDATDEVVYEAPDADRVPHLMQDLVSYLAAPTSEPPIVRAAMAHLNLVMIHPFSDGNGRMARALQTMVMVREERDLFDKEFCSIEEYLGATREAYYAALAAVGSKVWTPSGDTRPFLRFCLTAALHQAERLLRRSKRMGLIWTEIETEVNKRGLPARVMSALADAAMGFKVRNATYRPMVDITETLASRDLKLLVDQGLLIPEGHKRGRIYRAGGLINGLYHRAREAFPPMTYLDPFVVRGDPIAPLPPSSQ